jgi:hypothetical protein
MYRAKFDNIKGWEFPRIIPEQASGFLIISRDIIYPFPFYLHIFSFNMRGTHLLAMSGIAASAIASDWPRPGEASFNSGSLFDANPTHSPSTTCNYLKQYYPNITLLPEDAGYTAENEGEWNPSRFPSSACLLT